MRMSFDMSNKDVVLGFFEEVIKNHDVSKLEKYVKPDYMQHNPNAGQGIEGVRSFFSMMYEKFPNRRTEVLAIVEQGDMVALYQQSYNNGDDVISNKIIDVMRIEDGMLAEHWDIVEKVGDWSF